MPAFGVSYFGVRDPRHARRDLDEIAAAGFRTVTHTLSEHDLRYHEKDVARLVGETKARGLEAGLDPWGVGGIFGGEAWSERALTDLSSRQIDANGRSVPAVCPNSEAAHELLARWAAKAVELGADVLFWDEPHFHLGALLPPPAAPCCRCASCEAAWRRSRGGALPEESTAELRAFRTESLRRLLASAITAGGPTVRHSLCLLPRGEFSAAGSDDWDAFASVPGLSRLSTDPYWMNRPVDAKEFVSRHSAPLRDLCNRTRMQMEVWIQGIRIPAGDEGKITAGVEAAVEAGAEIVSFWSFRGTERMSDLACGDPDAVWRAMCEAVRRYP